MSNYFTYSVLQYKHSLILGEVLNVGILFYFQNEDKFEFVRGDGHRAKSIYPDFDNSIFNGYLKTITNKVKEHVQFFNLKSDKKDFAKYIHQNILAEDASGLIFREPIQIKNVFSNNQEVIDEYSRILLPGILTERPSIIKHNENFILRTFTGYLFGKDKAIEKKFKKNEIIKTKHFTIKFDLSWKNESRHFIKPLSFDLTDETSIQNKAAITYSHLIELSEYSKNNNYSFDLLIAKPQSSQFNRDYENALDLIDSAKVSKQLITESKWKNYTKETLDILVKN